MKSSNISEDYNTVMPYIIVKDAAGFMNFMQDVFGAIEKMKVLDESGGIMHAEVFIHESVIMFANNTEQFLPQNAGLFVYVTSADEIYQKALQAGATSIMEPRDQEYGRSGGITDPYGNTWWITSVID